MIVPAIPDADGKIRAVWMFPLKRIDGEGRDGPTRYPVCSTVADLQHHGTTRHEHHHDAQRRVTQATKHPWEAKTHGAPR